MSDVSEDEAEVSLNMEQIKCYPRIYISIFRTFKVKSIPVAVKVPFCFDATLMKDSELILSFAFFAVQDS